MKKIMVNLGERSYPVLIGCGIVDKIGLEIEKYIKCKKIMLVTNSKVNRLYRKKILEPLKKLGLTLYFLVIPDGEEYKNIRVVEKIYKECAKNSLHRDSCIIALGGGVISDMAGFAAATYMRGINLVNIPTSLVGQVDAAIGGKTGINFEAKNIIGSFYQPKLVLIDINFLKTLPEKEIKNGLAEIIKYAIIKDVKLFRFLEKNREKIISLDKDYLMKIIYKCCLIKAKIIEKDEKENNLRVILNYGHTIGHAIEKVSNYKVQHGEAVASGMIVENRIAKQINLLGEKEEKRIENLIERYGLVNEINLKKEDILEATKFDKKVASEKIRFVLPMKIGKVCVSNVPVEIVKRALKE